jgi:hypothetical protein
LFLIYINGIEKVIKGCRILQNENLLSKGNFLLIYFLFNCNIFYIKKSLTIINCVSYGSNNSIKAYYWQKKNNEILWGLWMEYKLEENCVERDIKHISLQWCITLWYACKRLIFIQHCNYLFYTLSNIWKGLGGSMS